VKNRYLLLILLMAFGILFVYSGTCTLICAQPLTHTVKKGDTLWDICEEYYGNPGLWPKLWEMNSFITNPHLLTPGDVITLLEDVPVKKEPPIAPIEKKKRAPLERGIDVSGFTNVDATGFFSFQELEAWGSIFSDETLREGLYKGDTIYVAIEKGREAKSGDVFTIYRKSSLLNHPLTGKDLGYAISFLGRLKLKDKVKENIYQAEITANYRSIHRGDLILPYRPASPCVQPVPVDHNLTTNIVAIKDQREMIGQFSVVYLEHGTDKGIKRGNLFEVIRERRVESSPNASLPDVVLGHVLVLDSRADTATGVVIAAKEEFSKGAHLKGVDCAKAKRVLSALPKCLVK